MQIAIILSREFSLAVVTRRAAGDHALAEFARGRNNRGLLVVEAKRRGIKDRAVERDGLRIGLAGGQ